MTILATSSSKVLLRERRLPIPGDVLVQVSEHVLPDTLIARAEVPGTPVGVSLAARLDVPPEQIEKYVLKQVGDEVELGEPLAMYSGLFGLAKKTIYAPTTGTVESVSTVTGVVIIREPNIPVEVKAYVSGVVARIIDQEGAEIESHATVLHGKFGVGGERWGELHNLVNSPDQVVTPELLTGDLRGKILLGGALISVAALHKAAQAGAVGVVVGGIDNSELAEFVGYDIGVPITGQEKVSLSVIVTDGFGHTPMSDDTFSLLSRHEGQQVSINGTTHLRANLIKPEIIIPA